MSNVIGPDHAPHQPLPGANVSAHNAALLIDFDNVTMGIRSDLQNQLRKLLSSEVIRGKVAVQRAYADWRRYPQYIVPLSESSIDLIFAPAFGSNKKNATDIRLAIDALELVFTRPEIGTFILLSGDSDFSSLVLKLKEYGKFVIGVGIRESASDLLIQNCDEYYSYSELTGLAKQAESDTLPRDPWELVVEAVDRMENQRDVMRSDRLKQVMQELDPHFDEKDAGFNKFSKFVQESARRGLVLLEKMENGQFEVSLGPDANVSLSEGRTDSGPGEEKSEKRERFRGSAARSALGKSGLVLADALALLKRTLLDLGAHDDGSTDADTARARMMQLAEDDSDPILESGRFHRLLRQAHDASIVELVKTEDETYLVKLMPDITPVDPKPEEKPKATRKRAPRKKVTKSAEPEIPETSSEQVASPASEPAASTVSEPVASPALPVPAVESPKPSEALDPVDDEKSPPKKASKKKVAKKKTPTKKKATTKNMTIQTEAQAAAADEPTERLVAEPVTKTTASKSKVMGFRSGSRGASKPKSNPPKSHDDSSDDRSALRQPDELPKGRRSLRSRRGGRSAPASTDSTDKKEEKLSAEPPAPPQKREPAVSEKREYVVAPPLAEKRASPPRAGNETSSALERILRSSPTAENPGDAATTGETGIAVVTPGEINGVGAPPGETGIAAVTPGEINVVGAPPGETGIAVVTPGEINVVGATPRETSFVATPTRETSFVVTPARKIEVAGTQDCNSCFNKKTVPQYCTPERRITGSTEWFVQTYEDGSPPCRVR